MGLGARGTNPSLVLVVWSSEKNAEIKYFFLHYDERGREFEYQSLRGALEFAKSLGGKIVITTPKLLGIGKINISMNLASRN